MIQPGFRPLRRGRIRAGLRSSNCWNLGPAGVCPIKSHPGFAPGPYTGSMRQLRSGMVDIVRDFLGVHELLSSMTRRYAEGTLGFGQVVQIVGDDSSSMLFRLKESCHAIFRPTSTDEKPEVGAGALLDLVLGSLFHEAMSLRENLYQLESYGARLQDLRGQADTDTSELFREFEKIQTASARRLEEAVAEVDVLLAQAVRQFFLLLSENKYDGLLIRCIWEHSDQVLSVFGQGVLELFSQLYGDPVVGLLRAADSYLDSAYYDEALLVLREASGRQSDDEAIGPRVHYANGMRSFMLRDYPQSVSALLKWWGLGRPKEKEDRIQLALEATQYMESMLDEGSADGTDASEIRVLGKELKAAAEG